MQERYPPVIQLAVHLVNGQRVFFIKETAQDKAAADPLTSTFTAFFYLCRSDPFASTIFYIDVPRFYVWNIKSWKRRKRGTRQEEDEMFETAVIGRMYAVSPSQGERFFFLSLLLHHVQGPRSYKDLKTANDTLCLTYRDVCIRRKLLENDNVHLLTPEEASVGVSPKQLR